MRLVFFFSLVITTTACAGAFVHTSKTTVLHPLILGGSRPAFRLQDAATSTTDSSISSSCDVLVLGAGPTGRAIASLLANKDLKVTLADANFDRPFVPNYGVWQDEWQAVVNRYAENGIDLEGGKCGKALDREWEYTDCFFGGSFDKPMTERLTVNRPYARVDKDALRDSFKTDNINVLKLNHMSKATSVNIYNPPGSMVHDAQGTTTVLHDAKDKSITTTVRSKLVIDTTGHESTLVLRDSRAPANAPPGFQIAYGCIAEIKEAMPDALTIGPYDKDAMTLFDYRTDHLEFDPEWEKRAIEQPSFMYAMPLEGNKVFFEETSLVARPAMSFAECKDRCFQRLKFLDIDVQKVTEEEYCYIPMGGSLPLKDQRVIGLGGSAAMVHPSTGYHLCRMLMGASDVAQAISKELLEEETPNLDRAAASAYHALWSPENIRQRNFAVYGGEFLMEQNVEGLRGFFDGFFRLPIDLWAGFLAGWPGLPNNDKHQSWQARIWFGLSFIVKLPAPVALNMVRSIITYSLTEGAPLPQSVTPFLGQPPSYEYRNHLNQNVGDNTAKQEAYQMILESKVTETMPKDFDTADDEFKEKIAKMIAERETSQAAEIILHEDSLEEIPTAAETIIEEEVSVVELGLSGEASKVDESFDEAALMISNSEGNEDFAETTIAEETSGSDGAAYDDGFPSEASNIEVSDEFESMQQDKNLLADESITEVTFAFEGSNREAEDDLLVKRKDEEILLGDETTIETEFRGESNDNEIEKDLPQMGIPTSVEQDFAGNVLLEMRQEKEIDEPTEFVDGVDGNEIVDVSTGDKTAQMDEIPINDSKEKEENHRSTSQEQETLKVDEVGTELTLSSEFDSGDGKEKIVSLMMENLSVVDELDNESIKDEKNLMEMIHDDALLMGETSTLMASDDDGKTVEDVFVPETVQGETSQVETLDEMPDDRVLTAEGRESSSDEAVFETNQNTVSNVRSNSNDVFTEDASADD